MHRLIAGIILLFAFTEAQDIIFPCTCGERTISVEPRIAGGDPTEPKEFPMMVAIFYVPQFVRSVSCGGTIISENYVLTAAHCVRNVELSALEIVVGEYNITVQNDPWRQVFKAESYTVHPSYNEDTNDYDIAVIRVSGQIEFNRRVSPVCLPYKYVDVDLTGKNVWLSGWGTLSFGGPVSKILRKVSVSIISQARCMTSEPTLTSRQICTQTTGKDACQFDSGGPAFYEDSESGSLFLIGIISYGKNCGTGNHPGVNTRVTALLGWIEKNAPADYCHK